MKRAVCINLDASRHRWGVFYRQLNDQITRHIGAVERVSAYSPRTMPMPLPEWLRLTDKSWACYQSHLAQIERGIADGVTELLILEDDAVFDRTFSSAYMEFRSAVPDGWDALYLGGRHKRPPFDVRAHYVRCRDTVLHHAWMLSASGLVKLRDHLRDLQGLRALRHRKQNKDQWCGEGMSLEKFIAYAPRQRWLVHQRGGKSDRNNTFHPSRFGGCRTRPDVAWPAA